MKSATVTIGSLDASLILSPERYMGRDGSGSDDDGILLSDLAEVRKETVSASRPLSSRVLVADTGDAEEGILKLDDRNAVVPGSTKKRVHDGDVLISRLRPYLRQVAYADSELFSEDTAVAVSTEFYVLKPSDEDSIAYLVPWLLSRDVQDALAASLEGAHHPRFHISTLLQLRVPHEIIAQRAHLSQEVAEAANHYRTARRILHNALQQVESHSSRSSSK